MFSSKSFLPSLTKFYLTNLRLCSGEAVNPIRYSNLEDFPQPSIRNFGIVAHVDHGKSTLADRILEEVGSISKLRNNQQVLDKLKVERDKGITVKAQSVSFVYNYQNENFLINLIDTPGHVDFSSEVTRSLKSCQGVILLVDATQGVQAQTISNFHLAFSEHLTILPVINKIDLPRSDVNQVKKQMSSLFKIKPHDVSCISAKLGVGIKEVLSRIVTEIPPPRYVSTSSNLKCFLLDSWYDRYKGAIILVQVLEGKLSSGMRIMSQSTNKTYTVKTLGLLIPDEFQVDCVYPGQIAYLTCNMRSTKEVLIGDIFSSENHDNMNKDTVTKLKIPQPMLYAGFYPKDQSEFSKLCKAIEKICLNDMSVSMSPESNVSLGQGFKMGFLGLLHLEVFTQRIRDEYKVDIVVTNPSVTYKIKLKKSDKLLEVESPSNWPESTLIEECYEPIVRGTIICPSKNLNEISFLINTCRGREMNTHFTDSDDVKLEVIIPLNEILSTFYCDLKSITSGYGSFDYEHGGYEKANLVKIDILLNGRRIKDFSAICHKIRSQSFGRDIVEKLKKNLPRQQFLIAIQALIGGKVIARETIKPYKKDVTSKCYGGDLTRQKKLLRLQAEGKKRMRSEGNVEISKDTFIKILSK